MCDVYEAVNAPPLFDIGPGAEPAVCLVEGAVDARLDASLREAEARLLEEFSKVTVEHVAKEFEREAADHRLNSEGTGSLSDQG